ncbi:DUF2061 domain-containing protein [Candidatus Microgenomates bacterium]|nr:DUF2061 domain-containing protein [Candidatus Microgenomates bacterium]
MSTFFKEHFSRSFVKAITFRLLVIVSNVIIITVVTGEARVVFSVVLVSTIANTILYILHERVWNKVKWGRGKH